MGKLFMPPVLNSLTRSWKMGHIDIFHRPHTAPGESSLDCFMSVDGAHLDRFFCTTKRHNMESKLSLHQCWNGALPLAHRNSFSLRNSPAITSWKVKTRQVVECDYFFQRGTFFSLVKNIMLLPYFCLCK